MIFVEKTRVIVKRPVSASLARAFFYIVLLSILSTGIALLTLASSLRDAEAINIAGSLRMQSYRLATTCKVAVHNSMHIVSYFSRHCIHRY